MTQVATQRALHLLLVKLTMRLHLQHPLLFGHSPLTRRTTWSCFRALIPTRDLAQWRFILRRKTSGESMGRPVLSLIWHMSTRVARRRTQFTSIGCWWKCAVCNGSSLLTIALLLLHQRALDTAEVLRGCIDQLLRLIRVPESLEHGSHLSLRLDMWTCSAVAEMRQTTETTVLDTCGLQLTCTLRMLLVACRTNAITV
jgi:hypothetical protein